MLKDEETESLLVAKADALLVAHADFHNEPEYEQGVIGKKYLIRELQKHEVKLVKMEIAKVESMIGDLDSDAMEEGKVNSGTTPGQSISIVPDTTTPITKPDAPVHLMTVHELKSYLKWLNYSIERFLPEEVILEKHGGFIERVLKADEYNQMKSAKLLKMEQMTKVIESLGQTVLVSTQTVGFLNAPRSDDWNEGEGFMLLTNSNDGDNFYLHMYEYDINCSLDSEQRRSFTTLGSKLFAEHASSDSAHRVTHGMYGCINLRDIIAAYQFQWSYTDYEANTKAKYEPHTTECCTCPLLCPCFAFCPSMRCVIRALRKYCTCCTQINEYEQTQLKIQTNMKKTLDELITRKDKKMETVSFSTKRQIEGNNQIFEMSGERYTSDAHKHFLGIELSYLDHCTRTQETGVILFRPDSDFASILNVVAQINISIKNRSHTMMQEKEELTYTLSEKNPLEILGISNAPGRNSSTLTLTSVTKMTQTKKKYFLVVFLIVVILIIIVASQS